MSKTLKTLADLEGFEVKARTFDDICEANSLDFDFDEAMEQVVEVIEALKKISTGEEQSKLTKAMSEIDGLINESNHFMENADLNASDGYKAYKVHQKLCRKRREIKDTIEQQRVIKKLYQNNKTLLGDLKQAKNAILEKSPERKRSYTFRNLDRYEEFKVFSGLDMTKFNVKIIRANS